MIHKEVKRCLKDCPSLQNPRDVKWNRIDERAYAIENTERSDPVQDNNAEPDEYVVVKGCSYHDGVTADEVLLFG